jgi:hypothetical protein
MLCLEVHGLLAPQLAALPVVTAYVANQVH